MQNAHGVNRMEHVRSFVIDDTTQPNGADRVPVILPATRTTTITIPTGGVGVVYQSVGFAAIAKEVQPHRGRHRTERQLGGCDGRHGRKHHQRPGYVEQWRPAIATRRDGRAMLLIAGSSTGAARERRPVRPPAGRV